MSEWYKTVASGRITKPRTTYGSANSWSHLRHVTKSSSLACFLIMCCLRSAFRVSTVEQYVQWNFCAFAWCVSIWAFKLLLCVKRNLQIYSTGKSHSKLTSRDFTYRALIRSFACSKRKGGWSIGRDRSAYLYEHVDDVSVWRCPDCNKSNADMSTVFPEGEVNKTSTKDDRVNSYASMCSYMASQLAQFNCCITTLFTFMRFFHGMSSKRMVRPVILNERLLTYSEHDELIRRLL